MVYWLELGSYEFVVNGLQCHTDFLRHIVYILSVQSTKTASFIRWEMDLGINFWRLRKTFKWIAPAIESKWEIIRRSYSDLRNLRRGGEKVEGRATRTIKES